ncbi:hypothetical protein BST36_02320 [Mycolicibacterium moriokaense]|jgi:hypothetical protein|uniref:Uncharacterized protein n=1 Tax=Mycolicibacterium moriokaense TaxID=39691 RepID=A0AAD1HFD9_9MYCO|nr:hypothetical protein [Mycolicibacterium moriokaense]MCV7039401.1 hypothetical protein [Mycolicibacterium moriokaense]ORB26775.1 hypothetical protein BST36_02320 [Mycolicibacterium moriokaense]BBX03926.1 hypothetical protein MMOR_48620 [Mycolicibacterium moriokaense]
MLLASDLPPDLQSRISPLLALAAFGVVVAASAMYAVYLSVRRRDVVPIVVCVGALICAFNEPIYDILGKIVYADNHPMAYTYFGREIPWFLVIGYLPWVGLLPYLVAQAMRNGVPRSKLHWLAFGSFVSVVVVETLGTSFEAWGYYGDPPLKFLVVAPQMAPVPIVGGFLLFAVADRLSGWKRAVAAFAISTVALPMVFASASWPLYVGLNADLPVVVNWFLAIAMLALAAATVAAATQLGENHRKLLELEVNTRLNASTHASMVDP